jgi:predicted membrane channel-forming protein YqfA (hemolysin III family)
VTGQAALSPSDRLRLTLALLSALLLGGVIVLFGFLPPISQNQAYHQFAPSRIEIAGIPNTLNVMTNIPFAIIGLAGLMYCRKVRQSFAPWSWRLFFAGVALTSVGSGIYHWDPNDASLVWDRMPMTIAFTSVFVALLSEQIHPELDRVLLAPLIIAGISSVLYWHYYGDLRAYGLVQFFPLVGLPLAVLIMPDRYDSGRWLFFALSFYVAAKIFEALDYETSNAVGISGHAIKHLLAACSTFCLYWMLKIRRTIQPAH